MIGSATNDDKGACATAPRVVWIVAFGDRREHAVTREQAEATAAAGTGIYQALCETTFVPELMTTRPGPRCLDCDRRFQRWVGAWRPTRPPLWRRLCRLRGSRRG